TAAGGGACTTATEVNGVVPWVTLGIAEADASDGWDRRLTYRVPPALVASASMDMSWCDPAGQITSPPAAAGSACSTTCTNTNLANCTPPSVFLMGKGLTIKNVVGTTLMAPPTTGAAYVVISHGESG